MVLETNLSLVKKVNRLLNWGHWFTLFNILLALVVTATYWLSDPVPQTMTGWLYLGFNWLGHTAFLCFMFFILTIFPVSLIFPYQRHVRGMAAVLATSAFVVLIFDAYVYASLGYHIGSASFDQAVDLLRQQIVTNLRNFVLIVIAVATLALAFELTLSNYCWKKAERLKQSGVAKPFLWLFIGSFMLSHLLHIYADANLKYDVTKQDNVLPLSYPATAKTFLARHQLLDSESSTGIQLDKFLVSEPVNHHHLLQCKTSTAARTALVVTKSLNVTQQQWLAAQGLKQLEPHFAPRQQQEALLHLLYGKFNASADATLLLDNPPYWLNQQPDDRLSVSVMPGTEPALAWLQQQPGSSFAIVFDDQFEQNWSAYQVYQHLVVMSLTSDQADFALAPTPVWTNWQTLRRLQPHLVTQHLDWIPTLLAQAGCQSDNLWPGDNLLAPDKLPKLTISGDTIISFKKDKMVMLRADGSYGAWSAGTLVPLNDTPDLPMLVDALKRIEKPQSP